MVTRCRILIHTVVLLNFAAAFPALSQSPKTVSTFYNAQSRANATENAKNHDWARQQVAEAVAAASPWIEMSDEDLWYLIFSPELPRAYAVNLDRGCPKCGQGIFAGKAPNVWVWKRWVPGHPWKVQCPNCSELFPKNDFGAFYRSGISKEDGLFHYNLADRSLLYNADHPSATDPLHLWGVDDGHGWQAAPGGENERDWFIGNHVCFGLWTQISVALRSLAEAYALTSEPIYAHKCAILLDRLADVFPGYDGKTQFYANGSGYWAGIIGPNYWDGVMWEQRAIDYDKIYDGIGKMPATLEFLRAKSHQYRTPLPKESLEDIRNNIEQRILVDGATKPDRIDMNGASTEVSKAIVQLVLRGQGAFADLINQSMPAIVPAQHLNNDGSGNELSLGYDSGNFSFYCSFLERLYNLDPAVARSVLEGYPRLRAAFDFWPDVWCLEKFIPSIGDSGAPGAVSRPIGTAEAYLALFDLTGNARYAQIALRIAEKSTGSLKRNIHAKDPDGVINRAVEADQKAGEWSTPSVLKPDYKLAILRAGKGSDAKALTLIYNSNRGTSSHKHFDALTFGLFAHGLEMICEQGYPLFTGGHPARWNWTSHTRSHATVTVDGQCQQQAPGGTLLGYAGREGVQMVSVEAPGVPYAQASVYRRTMLLVDAALERHFIVDVFRVEGGGVHDYTIPIFYGDTEVSGLAMRPQANLCDGYIESVSGAVMASSWHVDAAIKDKWGGDVSAHLRIHGPAMDGTLFTGQGETRSGHDSPERLPYVVLQRKGDAPLKSVFIAVYEPYRDTPFIDAKKIAINTGLSSPAITVPLAGGSGSYSFEVKDSTGATTVEVKRVAGDGMSQFVLSGKGGMN